MKILVGMQKPQRSLNSWKSIDNIIEGKTPCSGNDGSIVRLAGILAEAGLDVCLSTDDEIPSSKFPCIKNEEVDAERFDYLIVHQSHWDGITLTFGKSAINKTILWLHRQTCLAFIHTFLQAGGYRVVCPSIDSANSYRAIPEWRQKVAVIYNSYCPVFTPTPEPSQRQLLFIGAITPDKGFVELMKIWDYLVQKQVNLQLAIAGSISIHKGVSQVGAMGVATPNFETNQIQPWLEKLPADYQPHFFGALPPVQLRDEISRSWAAIVNPSWYSGETFCISAVDAQACDRTVFSIEAGGLKETVYRGEFNTLTKEKAPEALGDRIIEGLSNQEAVAENGRKAGNFVRSKFSDLAIRDAWINLLSGQKTYPSLPFTWETPRDCVRDIMRWTGTGMLINWYRSPHDRKLLMAAKKTK